MVVTPQTSLTLQFRPRDGSLDELRRRLDAASIPFELLEEIHFARVVLLPSKRKPDTGRDSPVYLMILADFDGPEDIFLSKFANVLGPSLEPFVSLCEGCPTSPGDRSAYLTQGRVRVAANYVNTMGQTVFRIKREDAIRRRLREHLDTNAHAYRGLDAASARERLREFASKECRELTLGIPPAGRYPTAGHWVEASLVVLVLILTIFIWFPITLIALLAIRWLESRDQVDTTPPTAEHVHELAAQEDLTASNQFSAYGFVKPGILRLATVKVVLAAAYFVIARFQTYRTLFGVKTIHFARWVFVSNETLFFASNYDGSQESYMDDFIDRIWWGLNGVFSNGIDYPKTEFLIFKGSRDEGAFKTFIRNHQTPTQVWYCAYPHLTCTDIANNTAICRGLIDQDSTDTRWLRLI